MAQRFAERNIMQEQIDLFYAEETFNLGNLRQYCYEYIKRKYPKPVDGEDYSDFLSFLKDESDLMFAEKMRQEADRIEERILGTQKKIIQTLYKK